MDFFFRLMLIQIFFPSAPAADRDDHVDFLERIFGADAALTPSNHTIKNDTVVRKN